MTTHLIVLHIPDQALLAEKTAAGLVRELPRMSAVKLVANLMSIESLDRPFSQGGKAWIQGKFSWLPTKSKRESVLSNFV